MTELVCIKNKYLPLAVFHRGLWRLTIRGISLTLLLLSFSAPKILAQPVSQGTEELASAVVHLVVTTSDGSREGSGVIVSPDGVIFTAAHVVEGDSKIRVELFDGFDVPPVFTYYARIQYLSPFVDFDFAVLEIFANEQQRSIDPSTLRLPYVQSWGYEVVVPDPIRIIGYLESAGGVPHVTLGNIGSVPSRPILTGDTTQNRYTFYQTDAVTGQGDSGGLVVNAASEFIGIPIWWENDGGGYVATILPIATICEIEPNACVYEPGEAVAPVIDYSISSEISLKYDETGAGELAPGQVELVAIPVRRAQSGVWNAATDEEAQNIMIAEIINIQQMAAMVGATTREGEPLTLEFGTAWLVWCSNATNVQEPAEVSTPLRIDHRGWGQIYILAPASSNATNSSLRTFSGCIGAEFWAVAVR